MLVCQLFIDASTALPASLRHPLNCCPVMYLALVLAL